MRELPHRAGRRAGGNARCLRFLLSLLLLWWLPARGATPARNTRTVEQLRGASAYAEPRAFVRGNNVRIYYALDGQPLLFKAAWKKMRLEGREYTYRLAELKYDQAPPKIPKPGSSWREATVLGPTRWAELAHAATERLTGPIPWRGTFLQLLATERILYRDDRRQLHAVKPEAVPARVRLAQRYNAQEFAIAMSRMLEASMKQAAGDQHLFLIADAQPGRILRFILLNTHKRRCVLLYAPRLGSEPKGGPQILSSARMWAAFLLESHGVALIKNPVSSVGRLLNLGFRGLTGLASLGLPAFRSPPLPLSQSAPMNAAAWEQWLDRTLGRPANHGAMRFLINGETFFPRFEQRLQAAQRSIDILVCIFDRDDVAVEIADLLRARSSEVKVRVILDRMMSDGAGNAPPNTPMRPGFVAPKSIGAYLQKGSAVRVRPYLNPWFSSEHSKLFIIDGRYAYVGGMNLGREYRHEWHDMMVEIEGPVVGYFVRDFERSWAHASLLGDLAYASHALFGARSPVDDARGNAWPKLRRIYTRTGNAQIRRAIRKALQRARHHVYLENSYLFDNQIVSALAQARHRGVDVRVVLPSYSDYESTDSSNYVTANYLWSNGVRVFLYPGMTHVKALIVDGWACLGSANFNRLSMQFNQEVNIATSHPATVDRLRKELFEVDFQKSREMKEAIKVSWTDHLAEYILNQL